MIGAHFAVGVAVNSRYIYRSNNASYTRFTGTIGRATGRTGATVRSGGRTSTARTSTRTSAGSYDARPGWRSTPLPNRGVEATSIRSLRSGGARQLHKKSARLVATSQLRRSPEATARLLFGPGIAGARPGRDRAAAADESGQSRVGFDYGEPRLPRIVPAPDQPSGWLVRAWAKQAARPTQANRGRHPFRASGLVSGRRLFLRLAPTTFDGRVSRQACWFAQVEVNCELVPIVGRVRKMRRGSAWAW